MSKNNWLVSLTITFILLGILLSTQLQTQNRLNSDLALQKASDLTIMVKNLSEKRLALMQEVAEAENTLKTYQKSHAGDTALLTQVNNELTKLNLALGNVGVHGPGIAITITKENRNYIAYDDIVSIINELWAAGAEAVAINNQRINFNSYFGYTNVLNDTYMTHNGDLLEYPIVITAIGDSPTLDKGLTMPGGIMDTLVSFGVHIQVAPLDKVTMPALSEKNPLRYGKAPEKNT